MSALSYVFGLHAVSSLLTHQPERVVRLCVLKERHDKKIEAIITTAKQLKIPYEIIPRQEFERLTHGEEHHQGIVALCEAAKIYDEADLDSLLPSEKPALI